jgi:polysaccharide export outer membrane protein
MIRACLLCALAIAVNMSAQARQSVSAVPAPTPPDALRPATSAPADGAVSGKSDVRYRIGAGDVLEVRLVKSPELSREAVRVDAQGMIRMPMLDEDIRAACLTEGELAREIATRYLKYKRNPHVDVFVKEYNSQPVALIGSVKIPGRFQLQRPVRLLELLSYAGGPSDNAGGRIQVVHSPMQSICENPAAAAAPDEDVAENFTYYTLSETMRGIDGSNPFVRPGDVISLPEADQAFIVGNVLRPMAIALREPITLSRAIAMAGGLMPDTKTDKIRLVRQPPGGSAKTELTIDLKAVRQRRAEDITLQAGDIVEVPTSGGKRFLRTLTGTIAPAVSQLPVRVIP